MNEMHQTYTLSKWKFILADSHIACIFVSIYIYIYNAGTVRCSIHTHTTTIVRAVLIRIYIHKLNAAARRAGASQNTKAFISIRIVLGLVRYMSQRAAVNVYIN